MRKIALLLSLCFVFVVFGCTSQPPRSDVVDVSEPVCEPAPGKWRTIGSSTQGQSIRAWSKGTGSRHILYLACIHGDEQSGRPLLDRLIRHIDGHPELLDGKKVTVIPVANPDGFARGSRTNANGVDLNRNFPTNNFKPSSGHGMAPTSEPETRALCGVIRRQRPDVIVTVHSPLKCVDYDGPALGLAHRMSRHCGLPVKKLGARPGSLGSYAGLDLNIPIVTLELAHHRPGGSSSWANIGPALLEALSDRHAGRIGVTTYVQHGSAALPAK